MAQTDSRIPEPPSLHPLEAFELFYFFCAAHREGRITFRQFTEGMKAFRFYDERQQVWTIGAGTGRWYRLDGGRWLAGEPNSRLTATALKGWYDYFQRIGQPKGCARCGVKVPAGSKFCLNCGAPVTAAPASKETGQKPVYCRQCGQPVAAGAKFCNACGTRRQ
ncbi:zinc ribbon domain-containing protein [Dehalogenimonas sp. 4OHTPN]|uniref:Zinc ribbon domain-containing protein n=1 Tax=Dehalogenimonas sp. 4OHTPN TaxID=3166643 RepID=A0AAU8GD70_9CHLR